ncbi:MAG: prephenate dehydrogenase [Anaerolineae bacterium]
MKAAQVAIVGLGLMGGSLAMALQQRQACRRVTALVRRPEVARRAEGDGVVAWAATDPARVLAGADLVVLSTPVRTIIRHLDQFAPRFKPGAVITDLGSTKGEITARMAALPPAVYPVGSHPMCGKEVTGLAAAEASLYQDAPWVISPLPRTPPGAVRLVTDLALAVGARPVLMPPERHDRLVAAISHLPYTLAAALVLAAETVAGNDDAVWSLAASGFRDTSRLAASDVTMMIDILLTNRNAVGAMLDGVRRVLDELAAALAAGDETVLRERLQRAHEQRTALYR